jgi:ferritin-like metal-binding protein YciE
MTTIQEIFLHELKDLHSAESQMLKALPKLAKAAKSPELAKAFEDHLTETEGHKKRLDKIAEILGQKLTGETCDAMKGLVEEGNGIISEFDKSVSRDAALIAAAQRVEHYEIAAYGCAREMAKVLGHSDVAKLLDETLKEEGQADKALTKVAVSNILPAALEESKTPATK